MPSPYNFPYPPVESSGDWYVELPGGGACVGQVLVYGVPVGPPTPTFLRWPCDESALPILEISGADHNLVSMTTGAFDFDHDSLRSDSAGSSVVQLGATDSEGLWEPDIATGTGDFTFIALVGVEGSFGASTLNIGIQGVLQIRLGYTLSVPDPPQLYLWSAGTPHLVLSTFTFTYPFIAVRVEPSGDFTVWSGASIVATGTYGSYDPDTDWRVRVSMNDGDTFMFQEIHVATEFRTDAEIEAVRLDLIGI